MLDGGTNYRRKNSLRLEGYDYSLPGAYFVTICVRDRRRILGRIEKGRVIQTASGRIVASVWNCLPSHYPNASLDEWVVMPNHVHGIVVINDVGVGFKPTPTSDQKIHGLSEIVRGFKTYSSRQINTYQKTPGNPVWQSGYWDRVIRPEEDLDRIRGYIQSNPVRWLDDRLSAS